MWRSASRTLKSTFRKGVLKCNTVLSTNSLQNADLQGLLKFTPFLLNHCNRFYNCYRGTTENFTKENSEGPKEKKTSFLECFDIHFIDVLKWGGIFALNYFTALQFKLKKLFPPEPYEDHVLPKTIGYHDTLRYVVNFTGIKAYNCVIPEVQAAKSKNSEQQVTETATNNFKSDEEKFNNLERAHKTVIGALSNLLGAQCMQCGQHEEAFEHFMQSAEEDHAPGIFNLGICHEKGLGTSRNLQKAAELYQRAADLGHATAMYNLGVFYAQGRGKIQVDLDHARKLFKAAASLGQADAINALNLEKESVKSVPENVFIFNENAGKNTLNNLIYNTILGQLTSNSCREFRDCKSKVKSHCHSFEIPLSRKEMISLLDSDSGVLDLLPHN